MKQRSRRDWAFFAIAWVLHAFGVAALFALAAVTQNENEPWIWGTFCALFFGTPVLVGIASMSLFGRRGRIKNAFALAGLCLLIYFFSFLLLAGSQSLLHGPRYFLLGTARGTVEEVGANEAAWVEITPAFVDTTRFGRATSTSTDNKGRSSTTVAEVSPIVAAPGELDRDAMRREPVHVFLCDRGVRDAGTGTGTVAGRMHRADSLERDAIAKIEALVRDDVEPMCVTPGRASSVIWIVLWVLLVLAVGTIGGYAAMANRK